MKSIALLLLYYFHTQALQLAVSMGKDLVYFTYTACTEPKRGFYTYTLIMPHIVVSISHLHTFPPQYASYNYHNTIKQLHVY